LPELEELKQKIIFQIASQDLKSKLLSHVFFTKAEWKNAKSLLIRISVKFRPIWPIIFAGFSKF